eukprot:scaffold37586_cov298-Amphora_coffeaeformis.AAC.2
MDDLLVTAYRRRLNIDDDVALPPTWDTLQLLTERHLAYLPFENLSMHMTFKSTTNTNNSNNDNYYYYTAATAIVMDEASLIQKLLLQRRGGCCLELNGLLALLLERLGYDSVRLVPCFVAAGRERGNAGVTKFRTTASHFIILVDGCCVVDVGFGEPPLGPLRYYAAALNSVQTTPDGMKSRIRWDPKGTWIDGRTGQPRTCLIQEWCIGNNNNNNWQPRLQWDVADAPLLDNISSAEKKPVQSQSVSQGVLSQSSSPSSSSSSSSAHKPVIYQLQSFARVRELLMHPKSSFCRKLIACRLTREAKITLAGRCLKITTPRFARGGSATTTDDNGGTSPTTKQVQPQQTTTALTSTAAILELLRKEFGIVLQDNQQLDFAKTDQASNTKLWDHL